MDSRHSAILLMSGKVSAVIKTLMCHRAAAFIQQFSLGFLRSLLGLPLVERLVRPHRPVPELEEGAVRACSTNKHGQMLSNQQSWLTDVMAVVVVVPGSAALDG